MALDDLDLEFEDEEEAAKKKRGDALNVDVDLEFHVPDSVQRRPSRPAAPPTSTASAVATNPVASTPRPTAPSAGADVKNINDARVSVGARPVASQVAPIKRPDIQPRPAATASSSQVSTPRVQGSAAVKTDSMSLPSDLDEHESLEVVELREKLRKTEFDSEVKVQLAEFKAEFIGEMLGDMKLMEHQIGQLLIRINAKHPDLKQEVLMIKKILADYTTKKRK